MIFPPLDSQEFFFFFLFILFLKELKFSWGIFNITMNIIDLSKPCLGGLAISSPKATSLSIESIHYLC